MNCCSIQHNKNIFTVFVGLIASGYNLVEESWKNKEILELINNIQFNDEILGYFRKAITLTCEVNQYWPRSFFLTLASMHLSEEFPYEYKDFNNLVNYIKTLKQINPDELNEDTILWLKELPSIFVLLRNHIKFEELWNSYLYEINKYNEYYYKIASQTISSVLDLFDITEEDLPELIIIPNWLQAPQATELIIIDNKMYIVQSEPDKDSIIHELAHHILDKKLDECKQTVYNHLFLLKPVLEDMIRYQYAWAYDESSWSRVFEENLMRAVSIWVTHYDDLNKARVKANTFKDYGFIYVPTILDHFISHWKGLDNFNIFVESCLKSCCNASRA